MMTGCSKLVDTGSLERRVLFMSNCAGLYGKPASGAQRYCSKAMYGSLPSHFAFFSSVLIVCIALSTIPLDWGYLGLDVTRSKFHSVAKSWRSLLLNGMLSEMNVSGIP